MRQKPGALSDHESHATRVAWWASFFATIAVIAILGLVRSAQASTLPVSGSDGALAPLSLDTAEDEELEAEEIEFEECLEEEDEEECEEQVGGGADGSEACILRSASATVSVLKAHHRVRLALHYTAFSSALVSVEYSLRGHRGALKMGGDSRRFSRSGVFRDTETLGEAEMATVAAATAFDVRLHAVNTPHYCRQLFDRDLGTRHAASGGPVWTD